MMVVRNGAPFETSPPEPDDLPDPRTRNTKGFLAGRSVCGICPTDLDNPLLKRTRRAGGPHGHREQSRLFLLCLFGAVVFLRNNQPADDVIEVNVDEVTHLMAFQLYEAGYYRVSRGRVHPSSSLRG